VKQVFAVSPLAKKSADPQTDLTTTPMPIRLSFLTTPDAGRVLTHVVPNGGTAYSHSLINVPAGTDAHTAIQTWGSPHWQRHEPSDGHTLPDLSFLPVADVLDDESLKVWLAEPSHRDMLEYVFTALLTAPTDARIVLAAPAGDVALVVYAVTRAFPTSLTDDLTFSTYEADPLACKARIIGRDPGRAGWDLPDACYRDGVYGYNPTSGRKALLPRDVGFAAFALQSLASGDVAQLDELRGTWQRLGLTDHAPFDLIDRIARDSGELAKYEIASAVQTPSVAVWISSRPIAVNQITEWALDDREFATGTFPKIVQAIRQRPKDLADLAQQIKQAGFDAVTAGDVNRVGNAFDVIFPLAAPAKAAGIWTELLAKFADPAKLDWPMRWHLLPRLIRSRNQSGGSHDFSKWLDVPVEKLGELLALEIPKPLTLQAVRRTVERSESSDADMAKVARALAANPELARTVLQTSDESELDRSAKLFDALLDAAPEQPWFEELVGHASDYPAPLLNRFFESELARERVDADRVVRTHGDSLLTLFAGRSGLNTLGLRFLGNPPTDLLNNAGLLGFLSKLKEQESTGEELKSRIAAVETVRGYLDKPTFDADAMKAVAASLELNPTPLPATAKTEAFRAIARELTARADADTFPADLEAAMIHLGPVLAKGPSDLFQDLLREFRQSPSFATHHNQVSSTLAVALGAVKSPELSGQLEGLEPDAFAIASDAAKSRKRAILDAIEKRSEEWSKEARAKWGFLREAVRPPQTRYGRDAFCIAFGAALVGIGWLATKLV
jgi:hypothetical protein